MSDENEPIDSMVTPTPDLTDVRQLDDGGATALTGPIGPRCIGAFAFAVGLVVE
jgi:hypothetical protein